MRSADGYQLISYTHAQPANHVTIRKIGHRTVAVSSGPDTGPRAFWMEADGIVGILQGSDTPN